MTEKRVPDDILKVRISQLAFEDYGHRPIHVPNRAVEVILSTHEVQSFLKIHGLLAPQLNESRGVTGSSGGYWPQNAPYISGSLENVTVLEALNRVLTAFPDDILVYWNCPATKETPTKATRSKVDGESRFTSACFASTAGERATSAPPDPQCLLRSPLAVAAEMFPAPKDPSHQRRIFIFFFAS
jgi:hypothetical protein